MNERKATTQEGAGPLEDIQVWRQRSVRELLRGVVILGLPVLLLGLLLVRQTWLIPVYVAFYTGFVLLTFWRRSPYLLQVAAIMVLIYGLAASALFEDGLSGDGRVFLLTIPVLALLFLGPRQGTLALILSGLIMLAFAWAYTSGLLVIPEERVYSADWMAWLSGTFVFLLAGTVLLISQNYVLPRLAQALDRSHTLTHELEAHQRTLQQRVEERTALLRRRAEQFECVAQVGRAIAGQRDVDALIAEAVRQIAQRFGFYAAAVYLVDETGNWVILQSGSPDEADPWWVERERRLQVGGHDVVVQVAATGRPQIVPAADAAEHSQVSSDHPATRPEVALPLRAGGRLIGVLGIQAQPQEEFMPEDIGVLAVMADQLALTIENAHLLTATQQALRQAQLYRGQETHDVWEQALLRRGGQLTFLYDQIATRSISDQESPLSVEGRDGKTAVHPSSDGRSVLVAPIQVHGQPIGSLAFEAPKAWQSDDVALVEAAMQQISQALESARLMEEIQQRATQEQLAGQVTARMRESLDLDTVLQTAVREMREALRIAEVEVRLDTAFIK